MPWTSDADGGFSTGQPWLPLYSPHRQQSVSMQEANPRSVLNRFRAFMAWRKQHPALVSGMVELLNTAEPVFAFMRREGEDVVLAAFNLGDQAAELALPPKYRVAGDAYPEPIPHQSPDATIKLAPFQAVLWPMRQVSDRSQVLAHQHVA